MSGSVIWFEHLALTDTPVAGGKGANLGELTRAGFPVPPGFVVTADAYREAMDESGVRDELRELFTDACIRAQDRDALARASERLRGLVRKSGVPAGVREQVVAAYRRLGAGAAVAVRSSATAEDTAGTSFAGMHETFANVVGEQAVVASATRHQDWSPPQHATPSPRATTAEGHGSR